MHPKRWLCLATLALLLTGCRALVWTDWSRAVRPSPRPGSPARPDLSALGMRYEGKKLDLSLSEDQAVALALANHPGLRMALEEKEKARGDLMTAWSSVLPSASVSLTYHRMGEVATFTVSMPPAPPVEVEMGVRDNYKAELGVTQPLFLGGLGVRSIQLAGLGRDYAELAVDDAARQIAYGVRTTYLHVLFAREALAVLEKGLANAQAHLADVRQRLEQKVGTRFDVMRAEVKVANARAELLRGRNNVELARSALVRLLGLPADTRLRLTGALSFVPRPVDEAVSRQTAFRERLDLRQAGLRVEMQDKQVDLAVAEILPKAFAYWNWGWDKPSSSSVGGTEGDNYWNAGMAIEVPVFDGFAGLGKIRKAYAALRQARWAHEDLRQQAALEVKQAVTSLRNALSLLDSQRENVRQAEESLRLVKVGFAAGTNTQLDVLDVQTALTAARLNRLKAVFDCRSAALALLRAEGRLAAPRKEE